MVAFPPRLITVGTTPVLLLNANARRSQYTIVFPAVSKIAGNTGIVYVSVGTIPVATGGATQNGHSMLAGEQFGEVSNFPNDKVSTDAIYAIASASGQVVEVYEAILA